MTGIQREGHFSSACTAYLLLNTSSLGSKDKSDEKINQAGFQGLRGSYRKILFAEAKLLRVILTLPRHLAGFLGRQFLDGGRLLRFVR